MHPDFLFEDVRALCSFNADHYERNLISHGDWYDMLLLCWKPKQESAIHDHEGSSCAFRIVTGTCTEDQYQKTGKARAGTQVVMPCRTITYQPGQICSAQDEAIHKISNQSSTVSLVTLHIYSPPLHMNYYETEQGDCGYRPPEASAAGRSTQ